MEEERSFLLEFFSHDLQGSHGMSSLMAKALGGDIHGQRTKSITSFTWVFILGNTYLLCPLENHLHISKPTDVIPHKP